MFVFVRMIISGIAIVICWQIVRKKITPAKMKKMKIVLCIIFVLTCTALNFVPFENLFVTFETAEAAYDYCQPGKSGESFLIEGNESTFVVKNQNGTDSLLIVPKVENGWAVPLGIYLKTVADRVFEDFSVRVYQYNNSTDYYIKVLAKKSYIQSLTDSNNTVFTERTPSASDAPTFFIAYYAYVPNFNETYTLFVNGKSVALG